MTRTWRKSPWLPAVLATVCFLACLPSRAQTNLPPTTNLTGVHPNPGTPPLPPPKSPVDSFRALLDMPAAEQQKLLAMRPPAVRERIQEKINEYRSITREERELRLQATQLRWYLVPLLSVPPTNRAAHLALIPHPTRELVESRLRHWTLLPPPMRQVLLTNQEAVDYLTHPAGTTNSSPPSAETLRRKMNETVERFLELTQKEKQKALSNFSEVERQQMEKSIAAFEQLTPSQRARCVRSFTRFATMTPEERQGFLKNAERWSQMSPTEREAWRQLVSRAPILPPVIVTSKPPAAANGN